jgi:transcriptional regulator with XRE-family HTH domain
MPKVTGFYLFEWRKHKGATQQELADAMGLQKGYVSELENGKKRYNQDHLESAARFFGCAPGDILTINPLEEAPEPPTAEVVRIWDHIPLDSQPAALRMLKSLSGDD